MPANVYLPKDDITPVTTITPGQYHTSNPPPNYGHPQYLVPYNAYWHRAKVVLHYISVSMSFFLLVFTAAFSSKYIDVFFALPVYLAAGIWDSAELITVCARKRAKRGIHPGAHVGVELAIWLIAIGAATWLIFEHPNGSRYWYTEVGRPSYWSPDFNDSESTAVLTLTEIFIWGLGCVHFALFCRACHECKQRNMARKAVKMVFVPGGGEPFIIEEVALPGGHTTSNVPANLETGEFEYSAQYEQDLNVAPQKEVIPGFVH